MRFIGNVEKDAQVRAVASGALSSGDAVIVDSDGTVSVIDPSGSSESFTQAVGAESTFLTGNQIEKSVVAYDSSAGRIVISYRDDATKYGVAVVGQISGTSITFGTPVVWNSSGTNELSALFDENTGKIVLGGQSQGNSFYLIAIVGTVSGTSISFGSSVAVGDRSSGYCTIFSLSAGKVVAITEKSGGGFAGSVGTISGSSISFGSLSTGFNTGFPSAYHRGCAVGSTGGIIVTFANQSASNGEAIVGSVSGDTITWGSNTSFVSSNPGSPFPPVFDPVSGKVFIAFHSSSARVDAVVATVSGTSVSFGSITGSGLTGYDPVSAYNSDSAKFVVTYSDGSDHQKLLVATISGTTVSFGSQVSLSTSGGGKAGIGSIEGEGLFVISRSGDTYNTAVGQVFRPAYTAVTTNLTAENFLGFAAHTYADTQSALVNSTCTVDRNQSGLTAGQKYYVQTNGALGTTAGDPSVEAGTAISSTEIIVKG